MRILYFCEEYFCNHGGRTHAREFFAALKSLPEVEYAAVMSRNRNTSPNSKHTIVNSKRGKGYLGFLPPALRKFLRFFIPRHDAARKIISKIAQEKIDVLIVRHGGQNIPYGKIKKACPNLIICIEINAFIFDEHFHHIWFRPVWQLLELKMLQCADCFFTVSSYLKNYLVTKNIKETKILVNPNGVNEKLFGGISAPERNKARRQLKIPDKAFVLGYIGGAEKFRRLSQMVEAVEELKRNGQDDLYLLIIGPGDKSPLLNEKILQSQETLGKWISCLDRQPYDQIPFLMSAFDLAIFPFTNPYCSPLKLFEYLAMGLPAIGPDTPAVKEVFEDGEHLLMVSQDGSDFKEAILRLKESEDLKHRIGRKGRERVLSSYTWVNNAKRTLRHISLCQCK